MLERPLPQLLQSLVEACTKPTQMSDLIRTFMVLAHRLRHSEGVDWAKNELLGYADGAPVPIYRRVNGDLYIDTQIMSQTFPRQFITPLLLEEAMGTEYAESALRPELREPIGKLESLGFANKSGEYIAPFPAEIANMISPHLANGHQCIRLYRRYTASEFASVVDQAKTSLLSFLLALESEMSGPHGQQSSTISPERAGLLFRSIVFGGPIGASTAPQPFSMGGDA